MAAIHWNLRVVMARRKIKVRDLAEVTGIPRPVISRIRNEDYLPEIGGKRIAVLLKGINDLSQDAYGACHLTDLLEVADEKPLIQQVS